MEHELRDVVRDFATGVCVVSTCADHAAGRVHDAITAHSLTLVSATPPLVSLCLRHDPEFLADLLASRVCAVSILDAGAVDIARSLDRDRPDRQRAIRTLSAALGTRTGALVVDSPGWLECELRDYLLVGDHVILIGEVRAAGRQDRRPPLIFLRNGFHALEGA